MQLRWSRVFLFIFVCLGIQHFPSLLGKLVQEPIVFKKSSPNSYVASIEGLSPGKYFVAVGRSLGTWSLYVDDIEVASTQSIYGDVKSSLGLSAAFIRDYNAPHTVEIRFASTEEWRNRPFNSPIISTYRPGLLLQLVMSIHDFILGPLFSLLLLLTVFIYIRVASVDTTYVRALGLFGISSFFYTSYLAGFPELFFELKISTAGQLFTRSLLSAAMIYLISAFHRSNWFILCCYAFVAVGGVLLVISPSDDTLFYYKLQLVFYVITTLIALVPAVFTKSERRPFERSFLELLVATTILQIAAIAIYLFKGPSSFTVITTGFVVLLTLFGAINVFSLILEKVREREHLRAQLEAVSDFNKLASQVAHDIRSPIAVLETVAKGLPQSLNADASLLIAAAERVKRIADDLLFSRKMSNLDPDAPMETENVGLLLKQLIEHKRREYSNRTEIVILDLIPEKSLSTTVQANSDQFLRCISNLINNSVEAISDAGTVTIKLEDGQKTVIVAVTDTGPGLPAELLDKVGKEELKSQKTTGNGLGLKYVFDCAKLWNAQVIVNDKLNSGSEIALVLHKR